MKQEVIYITLFIVAAIAIIVAFASATIAVVGNDSNQVEVEVWKYQGHDMLKCTVNGHTSICHSPDCKKCLMVFD